MDVYQLSETHTAADHRYIDNDFAATYNVTLVRNGSCIYNCHSYAWYSQSSSNLYWMDYPDQYMTDGSYKQVFSAASNDRIYYNGTHSGIMKSRSMVTSKWGSCGVFTHSSTNVPGYDTNNLTYWRR